MVKLVIIYLLCVALFNLFDMTAIMLLMTNVINYITNTSIGTAIKSIFAKLGKLIDIVVFDSESALTTSGGINLGNIVWLGTIIRVVIVILLIRLLIKLVV